MAVWDSAGQRPQPSRSRRWLAEALSALDGRLRRHHAVFEYSDDPSCIFRLEISRSAWRLVLRDGTRLLPGQRIARLHFWNEQIPRVPPNGPTIPWARQMQRAIATSLEELASYLSSRPDLRDVAVICAVVPSFTRTQSEQLARIMARYGFETVTGPQYLPIAERLRRFGENILISLIVFAHNPGALRADTLTRVRVSIYLSRRVLEGKID